MTLQAVKDELRKGDNLIRLLEEIGCDYVKYEQGGSLITAQLPERFDSPNRRAVQVKTNKSLSCAIRNIGGFEGDIFNLVSYLKFNKKIHKLQEHLAESRNYICKFFGWNGLMVEISGKVVVKDYTSSLRELLGGKSKRIEVKHSDPIPEETLNPYMYKGEPIPHQLWIDDGISWGIQYYYGVGFDSLSGRITLPIRNTQGELIGVKGRSVKEGDEQKYIYLEKCSIRSTLFNYHYALPHILKFKRVYIFEAEKSTMQLATMGRLNSLALGSSDVTQEQGELIRRLGEDIEVILCYDNDKSLDDIYQHIRCIQDLKNVKILFDFKNIIKKYIKKHKPYLNVIGHSPTDFGKELFGYLIQNSLVEMDKTYYDEE